MSKRMGNIISGGVRFIIGLNQTDYSEDEPDFLEKNQVRLKRLVWS